MSKKNSPGSSTYKYRVTAIETGCKDAGIKPMPRDRWEGTFEIRAAKLSFRSYHTKRDAALIEMVTLCHQYLQEPWTPKLLAMKRL
jgi:hypothetical protein